jgi:hypothetical protein
MCDLKGSMLLRATGLSLRSAVPAASGEHDYRLAERDVLAWLQTLTLDLRTIDAKVVAALRAEAARAA